MRCRHYWHDTYVAFIHGRHTPPIVRICTEYKTINLKTQLLYKNNVKEQAKTENQWYGLKSNKTRGKKDFLYKDVRAIGNV